LEMKKISIFLLITAIILTGCVGTADITTEQTAYPVNINNIKILNKPNTVACLSSGLVSILKGLGYSKEIVGFPSDYNDESVLAEQKIGWALNPNLEAIGNIAPEIIFTTAPMAKAQLDKLALLDIRVMLVNEINSIESYMSFCLDVSKIMKGELKGNAEFSIIKGKAENQIKHISTQIGTKKKYLYIASANEYIVATDNTIQASVLNVFGENVASEYKDYNISPEEILALNPDLIITNDDISLVSENDVFSQLQAVKDGNIIQINNDLVSLKSKFIDETLLEIGSILYPELDLKVPESIPSSEETTSS
ncbi:MAG: ABC transporter substrate-binding protein, partial [Oscillospiraceae bacterium]